MSDPADPPIRLGGLVVKSKNSTQILQHYSNNYAIILLADVKI